ncbi:hypothetical protein FHS55_002160 [Angulomicrobium tetraedrale]|uniref:Uncharacterized protein n=1 Tax=Ancylobacter tetraedralis TaxID=217068 RepID=A0A839Z9Z3_9HYPH|nr:hypothetical protein [Ancylobacter tetraedralis]MBB3771561.1 hypothetical protein [Ancylobacter tetraedralis]
MPRALSSRPPSGRPVSRRLTTRNVRDALLCGLVVPFLVAALGTGIMHVAFALMIWSAR